MSFHLDRCHAESVQVPFAEESRFFGSFEVTYNDDSDLEITLYPVREDGDDHHTIVARFSNYYYIAIIDEKLFGLSYEISFPKILSGKNRGYNFPFQEIYGSKKLSSISELHKDFALGSIPVRHFMVLTTEHIIEIFCEDVGILRK